MVYVDLVATASPATVSHRIAQSLEDENYWEGKNVEVQETLMVAVVWRANGMNTAGTLVLDATDTSVAYSAE